MATVAGASRRKGLYFPVVGALMFLLALVGFSDNLFWDVGQPSNFDPKFVIHGLFALVWFFLLAAQPYLVRARRVDVHMRWGRIGMIAAGGMVITTAFIYAQTLPRLEVLRGPPVANAALLASFVVCLVLGYRFRKRPHLHKRLIFMGSFFVLMPLANRSAGHLGQDPMAITPLVWLILFASLIVQTFLDQRRLTWLPIAGLVWLFAVLSVAFR